MLFLSGEVAPGAECAGPAPVPGHAAAVLLRAAAGAGDQLQRRGRGGGGGGGGPGQAGGAAHPPGGEGGAAGQDPARGEHPHQLQDPDREHQRQARHPPLQAGQGGAKDNLVKNCFAIKINS